MIGPTITFTGGMRGLLDYVEHDGGIGALRELARLATRRTEHADLRVEVAALTEAMKALSGIQGIHVGAVREFGAERLRQLSAALLETEDR